MKGLLASLIPSPSPQLSSLAVRITLRRVRVSVIRSASNDSCGGGLGARLSSTHGVILWKGRQRAVSQSNFSPNFSLVFICSLLSKAHLVASFPGSPGMRIYIVRRAWYLFYVSMM